MSSEYTPIPSDEYIVVFRIIDGNLCSPTYAYLKTQQLRQTSESNIVTQQTFAGWLRGENNINVSILKRNGNGDPFHKTETNIMLPAFDKDNAKKVVYEIVAKIHDRYPLHGAATIVTKNADMLINLTVNTKTMSIANSN